MAPLRESQMFETNAPEDIEAMHPTNLADGLSKMQIASPHEWSTVTQISGHHLLTFEFPAIDLLPLGALPFLNSPANMEDRRRQDAESCRLETFGTAFFATFRIKTAPDSPVATV